MNITRDKGVMEDEACIFVTFDEGSTLEKVPCLEHVIGRLGNRYEQNT